ncbi:hypothetical protein ScPMuIL_000391 [Solemya velum]
MVNVRRKLNSFGECVEEAKKENKELGMRSIADFMSMKKKIGDQKCWRKRPQSNTELTELWDRLMGLELQLVDQLECRDLENQHHESLLEVSIVTLEKVIKNELDERSQKTSGW